MKRILSIAGSDSGGGAGIQADLKTITVLGGYGMSVITALTAQNTETVRAIHLIPHDFVQAQLDAVLEDIGADAIKTGMLATESLVHVVAQALQRHAVEHLVVDPVMVAKSGDALLSPAARHTMVSELFPLARLVTPNLPETESLCDGRVTTVAQMKEAARIIADMGPRFVLIKGGHLPDDPVDVLYDGTTFHTFSSPRIETRHTHGTGCTYSAAIATFLAQGLGVVEAVGRARAFLIRAIEAGLDLGHGHGPTNPYAWVADRMDRAEGRPSEPTPLKGDPA